MRAQASTFLWRFAGEPSPFGHPFTDVPAGSYFDEAVGWMSASGMTEDTTATTFNPHATTTRAQMATFLWKFAGQPTGFAHPFVDVPAGSYFDQAVGWMSALGITTGTSAITFSPEQPLTRAALITFLWRFAGEP